MNIFERNLEVLNMKSEYLAKKVAEHNKKDIDVIEGYDGYLTATANNKILNSLYNPINEAEVRIDGVDNVENLSVVINIGFGLGYEINELLRRINDKTIIISVITDMDIFKVAMENIDLSNIFNHERFGIIDGTVENFKLSFFNMAVELTYYGQNFAIYKHPVEAKLKEKLFYDIEKNIIDSYIYASYGIGNAPGDTLEGLENIIANINHVMKTFDINELKGKFKNIPAVCVASGPSLNKNLHLLKKINNKAVIFAADTIVEKLKEENIKFDAVSVLERPKLIYDKLFKGKPVENDVVLFGESVIYPKIFDESKGENVVLFKNTTTVEEFLPDRMNNLNELETGISVAHMNFALADYLGFSPIILIGQDLAYADDGHSHARGTIHEHNTVEDDKISKNTEEIYVEGIDGKLVKTTRVWKNFLEWFELQLMDKDIVCIDATEGGALIKGTKVMTFKEAIEKYCVNDLDLDFKKFFTNINKDVENDRKNIIYDELKKQLEDLNKAESSIKYEKRLLKNFKKEIDNNFDNIDDINEYIIPINDNIYKILEQPLFAFIIQALSVELGRKNNSMVEIRDKEDCLKWYDNQINYIDDIYGVLKLTKKIIKKGLKKTEVR